MKDNAGIAKLYFDKYQPILVAVSGGADSVALMLFLQQEGYLLTVANFDHQLRGEQGNEDQKFVQQLCKELEINFIGGTEDVAIYASNHKMSIEEAARECRYRFLFKTARAIGAQAVATGHTTNDQAETVLMHFIRGAGISGLKGMQPKTFISTFDDKIPIVRPFLEWTRQETEDYCVKANISPRLDLTNNDPSFFRNRIRLELIPYLEEYNSNIIATLHRSAQVLQGEYDILEEVTTQKLNEITISKSDRHYEFELATLQTIHWALMQRIFRKAAFELKPGLRDVDKQAVDRINLHRGVEVGGGLLTFIEGGHFFLTSDISQIPAFEYPQIAHPIPVEFGFVKFNSSWGVKVERVDISLLSATGYDRSNSHQSVFLDDSIDLERLIFRIPITGDRFEPLGMKNQTMKLTDLFINLKVPKRYREKFPILTIDDQILWIPGLRRANGFSVGSKPKGIIRITLEKQPNAN